MRKKTVSGVNVTPLKYARVNLFFFFAGITFCQDINDKIQVAYANAVK